jgi:hypothetical protein
MAQDLDKTRFRGIKPPQLKPPSQEEKTSGNFNGDFQTALGLCEVMVAWVRAQRDFDSALDLGMLTKSKILTQDEAHFLKKDTKKYGCLMPPSAASMPDSPYTFEKAYGLDDTQIEEITSCLQIFCSSCFPWARQSSSTLNQHIGGRAIDGIQLHRDKITVFHKYLGENHIWKLYSQILALVLNIAPHFVAWHGVVPENRQPNKHQIMHTTTHDDEEIGAVFGAGMASTTTEINQRYQSGIKKLIGIVHSTATFHNEGQAYISRDVNMKFTAFLRVSIVNIKQFSKYCKFTNNFYISSP